MIWLYHLPETRQVTIRCLKNNTWTTHTELLHDARLIFNASQCSIATHEVWILPKLQRTAQANLKTSHICTLDKINVVPNHELPLLEQIPPDAVTQLDKIISKTMVPSPSFDLPHTTSIAMWAATYVLGHHYYTGHLHSSHSRNPVHFPTLISTQLHHTMLFTKHYFRTQYHWSKSSLNTFRTPREIPNSEQWKSRAKCNIYCLFTTTSHIMVHKAKCIWNLQCNIATNNSQAASKTLLQNQQIHAMLAILRRLPYCYWTPASVATQITPRHLVYSPCQKPTLHTCIHMSPCYKAFTFCFLWISIQLTWCK